MRSEDFLFNLVQELNNSWRQTIDAIESGAMLEQRRSHVRHVRVVDAWSRSQYGTISVNATGEVVGIDLDAEEILQSNTQSVVEALVSALNSESAQPVYGVTYQETTV
ncbi:hypothetical protein ACFVH4_28115 [Nocardia ignorata]|uniref:hypothetical protein n=1 Tax=Nocardia ignorata TaxID=145285 RepID=UPI003628180D